MVVEFEKETGKVQGLSIDLVIPSKKAGVKVKQITSYAFQNNSSLSSVVIPPTVHYIGWKAFKNCENLTSVSLPNTTMEIGRSAFAHCPALVVTISQSDPNKIQLSGEGHFYEVQEIRVPPRSLESYKKADGWVTYAHIIKPIEQEQKQRRGRRI